jgi:bacteriorhodopsin
MNLPKWAWWMIGVAVILIIAAVLKIDFSIGAGGIHFTQGLVK